MRDQMLVVAPSFLAASQPPGWVSPPLTPCMCIQWDFSGLTAEHRLLWTKNPSKIWILYGPVVLYYRQIPGALELTKLRGQLEGSEWCPAAFLFPLNLRASRSRERCIQQLPSYIKWFFYPKKTNYSNHANTVPTCPRNGERKLSETPSGICTGQAGEQKNLPNLAISTTSNSMSNGSVIISG